MARILFVYSTIDGHTLEICERLQQITTGEGHETTLQELTADSEIELGEYDRFVIGASVRYGKHRPEVTRFINQNVDRLQATNSAFFSVNSIARKPDRRDVDSNPYVSKFFRRITWEPSETAIFGGKIEYPKYGFWDKAMIRFIMWMTNGPTDPNGTSDFTDWKEVESFGLKISAAD